MGARKEESQEDTGSVGSRCLGTREKRRINQEGSVNSITQIGKGNKENERDLGECMHLVIGGERRGVRVLRELNQNSGIMQKKAISRTKRMRES